MAVVRRSTQTERSLHHPKNDSWNRQGAKIAKFCKGNSLETSITRWVKQVLSLSVRVCLCVLGALWRFKCSF